MAGVHWVLTGKLAVASVVQSSLQHPKTGLWGAVREGMKVEHTAWCQGEFSVSLASFVLTWSIQHLLHDRYPGNDRGTNGQVIAGLGSGLSCANPQRDTGTGK